jgi:hypothetical protein
MINRRNRRSSARGSIKQPPQLGPGRPVSSSFKRKKIVAKMLVDIGALNIQGNKHQADRVIFNGFIELGGIYIKFLQLMMLKTKFFSTITPSEKMSVYDHVAVDQVDIKALLQKKIHATYLAQITELQLQPFAGGSFAQVYFARHSDGTPLVIKVLRPSLVVHIRSDLRMLGLIVGAIKGQLKIATDVGSLFKDFKNVVMKETDYGSEVRNADYFFHYFHNNSQIVIPKTYRELCADNIIVQEYVDGIALTDVIEAKDNGLDPHEYVRQKLGSDLTKQMASLGSELVQSIFIADKIFGDAHPGNLKLLSGDRVGIMDFGIAGQPPVDRRAFMILMQDLVTICEGGFDAGVTFINGMRYFTPDLYRSINTLSKAYTSKQSGKIDIMHEIRRAAIEAFEGSKDSTDFEQLLRGGRISTIMNGVINQGNRFSLHVVMDAGTVVALRTADGYISLVEALGLVEELIPSVLKTAIQETYNNGAVLSGRSETMEMESAVNVVSDWAQNLIESDPMFFAPLIKMIRYASKNKPAIAGTAPEIAGVDQALISNGSGGHFLQ